ncbi:MAG: YetF domain-containing protein [Nitrospirota bacterium]
MLFDSWTGLLRVAVVGSLAYISLVILLRISGKRTLSKMNAFDLVVTVAIGSTLATVLLSNQVALAEGVLALTLLIFLQFAVTWVSVRSKRFKRFIKAEPTMLLYRGEFLYDVMKRERVTEEEIAAAARREKVPSLDNVEAVVLETDGTFSIITRTGAANAEGRSSLEYVSNYNSGTSDGKGGQERPSRL